MHSINETYFETIDTNEKAYWLGFLFADGGITYRLGRPNKTNFSLKDPEPVITFKKHIESNHKLGIYDVFDKRTLKTYKRYSLQISNSIFTSHVVSKGLIGKHNYATTFPNIDEKFYSHFIRGLLDGDGHVVVNSTQNRISFLATTPIIQHIQNYINKNLGIGLTKIFVKAQNNTGDLVHININKLSDASKLVEFLYRESHPEIRLNRKYVKAKSIQTKYETLQSERIEYHFIKNGNLITTYDLKNFAQENNLIVGRLYEVHRGQRSHHKGWRKTT